MNQVILALICFIVGNKDHNSKVIEEVINLQDEVVYNVRTDGRGGIVVKAKGPNDKEWSNPKKFDVLENAGELLDNGALIVKTNDNNYILAYAPKPEDFEHIPLQQSFNIDEYKKLSTDKKTEEEFYKNDPRFIEGVQTPKGSTYYDYKPTNEQKKKANKPQKKDKKKNEKKENDASEELEKSGADKGMVFLTICMGILVMISI